MKTPIILAFTVCGALADPDSQATTQSRLTGGWSLSSVSAGLAWRNFGEAKYSGNSRSPGLPLPSQVGGSSLTNPPIGGAGYDTRTYDDGYVGQDAITAASGQTWNWGYQSSDQIQGNSLVFTATGSQSIYSENATFRPAPDSRDDLTGLSPQLDLHFSPPEGGESAFTGYLLSLWHFQDSQDHSFSNYRNLQQRDDYQLDFTDRFTLGGVIPPSAPYSGNETGPGPIIDNIPITREESSQLTNSETALFTNSVRTSLDLNAFSVALGPTFSGPFDDNWLWETSAGVTLNYFDWNARQSETLSLSLDGGPASAFRKWSDSDSGDKFKLGLFAKASVIRKLHDDWFLKGYLQGEIVDSFNIRVGGSKYEVSPAGYALGFSFGRSF
ncbi:hypothetical protein V2O64_20995 [Verrucomicrobiaceae bacterium 227]